MLKFLLFTGIGVALVYLIIRKISPEDRVNIIQAFKDANYLWVGVSLVLGLLSHFLRGLRWRLLVEPIDKKPGIINSFLAVLIGYMGNYVFPRLGEVSKCGIIARYEKISFPGLIGTVIVERVVDLVMLMLFFAVMLLLSFSKVYDIVKTKATIVVNNELASLKHNAVVIVIGAIVIVALGLSAYMKRNHLTGLAKKFIDNFFGGIKSIGKLKNPALFWFYSVAIWVLYLLMLYACFFCFSETSHLTLVDALVVLSFATFGVIAPTPGGVGAYQWIVIAVLTHLYLISQKIAFTLAWIIWGSQLVLIVILGMLSLILLPIINKNDQAGIHTV